MHKKIIYLLLMGLLLFSCSTNPSPNLVVIEIKPSEWNKTTTSWNLMLGCNGIPSKNCEQNNHVYGSEYGQFEYAFSLPSSNYGVSRITARLSSEYANVSPSNQPSDVRLTLNNNTYAPITVTPDDGIGTIYEWSILPNHLKGGMNNVIFSVASNATNRHGLCIYYADGQYPITIFAKGL
jgi:hypothetical protein